MWAKVQIYNEQAILLYSTIIQYLLWNRCYICPKGQTIHFFLHEVPRGTYSGVEGSPYCILEWWLLHHDESPYAAVNAYTLWLYALLLYLPEDRNVNHFRRTSAKNCISSPQSLWRAIQSIWIGSKVFAFIIIISLRLAIICSGKMWWTELQGAVAKLKGILPQ